MYPHAPLWDLKPCCDLSPPTPLRPALARIELKVFSAKENGKACVLHSLPCEHRMKTLFNKEHGRVYNDATFATVSQQTESHLSHTECRWDLFFPLANIRFWQSVYMRPIHHWIFQLHLHYSGSWLQITSVKKTQSLMLLSVRVWTHCVHWEQTELGLSDCSLTCSCCIKEIIFFM